MTTFGTDGGSREGGSRDGDRWHDGGAWVVGVDGSSCSRHALEWATQHAPSRAAALHLVTAWQVPIIAPVAAAGPASMVYDDRGLEDAAREEVERLAREARTSVTVPVESIVVHGGPASALLEAAAHGSLLVVGSRGRGGFSRLMLGSTSSQCATHAEVPTAVIPADAPIGPASHVTVGIDGSANAMAALQWAVRFAAPDSTVEAVWVWDAAPLAVGADEFFFPDASDLAIERFDHLVDAFADLAAQRSVHLERSFVQGRARKELAEAGARSDLLVVGARGHGAIGSALLGSVSSWLLHHVHRPMVVVPHAHDAESAAPES